ncbi:MAG: hypothetical protein K6G55_07570 [Selenomonadaceae bacterium]|nr:hypothetical protein [Selenomonadaceae bacterium]
MNIVNLGEPSRTYGNANQIGNKRVPSTSFANLLTETVFADSPTKSVQSFEDMWKSKFPEAKYHVMDASKISQGVWERNDFPFEKFFAESVDESVLNWQPTGIEPQMSDSNVQTKLNSTLGTKSILVPPELDEKMKTDSELSEKVMDKVNGFIANHPTRPGRVLSYLIALDGNGDIAHFRVTGGGGHISAPSKEELRQFEAEQAVQKERKAKLEANQNVADERRLKEAENLRRKDIESDF